MENPFETSHTAAGGDSFVTTTYDFAWSGDSASFNIVSHQHMEGLDGEVSAGGRIYFTPMADSRLVLSATYDYAWPPSVIGLSTAGFLVADFTDNRNIFNGGEQGGNSGLDPPFGILTVPETRLRLFAGHDYVLQYSSLTLQFNASASGTFGVADAAIHFTIFPIPEPATIALLAPALVICRRRRSRRSR